MTNKTDKAYNLPQQLAFQGAGSGGSRRCPNDWQLLVEYQHNPIVYSFANKNANGVATNPLRLYVQTTGNTATKSLKTKKVSLKVQKQIRKSRKAMSEGTNIEEVTDHPLLTLLYEVNDQLNGNQLWFVTSLYLEILGRAYWKVDANPVSGEPDRLWILPPQSVSPITGEDGFVVAYKYRVGNSYKIFRKVGVEAGVKGTEGAEADGEVIPFLFNSLANPYTLGQSPLMAAYSHVVLSSNLTDFENALIGNRARPDGMLIPKGETNEEDAKRLLKSFEQKFTGSGNGRTLVADAAFTYVPLSYTPTDLGALQINAETQKMVAAAFDVPEALYSKDANRANADAAHYQHARYAIAPRCLNIEQQLNATLVPLFGDDRLFLCFDNPVPEDEASEREEDKVRLEQIKVAASLGAATVDEVREACDLPPATSGGEELVGAGVPTGAAAGGPGSAPAATDPATPEEIPLGSEQTLQTTEAAVLNGAQIVAALDIVSRVVLGQLPRDAGLGMLQTLFNLRPDQAELIMGSAGTSVATTPNPSPAVPSALPAINDQVAAGKLSRAVAINQVAKLLNVSQEEAKGLVGYPVDPAKKKGKDRLEEPYEVAARHKLAKILLDHYGKLESHFKGEVTKAAGDMTTKANGDRLPSKFIPLEEWDGTVAHASQPVLELTARASANGRIRTYQRLGASPDVFSVVPAKIEEAVDKAALNFAKSTQETIVGKLNDRLEELRGKLKEGLLEGDGIPELTDAVGEIVNDPDRAELIARTETSRAVHTGMDIAARESGVVSGYEWLLSDDACEVCQPFDGKKVGFGESFGDGVDLPPAHPNCRCTVTEILKEEGDEGE